MSSSSYAAELGRAMDMLAEDPRVVFLGQAVACPGTSMSGTLGNIPLSRRIEMPVAEEMQMGMSIGLALQGHIPVSIYPRWNFLLLAANQLVNHLDKMSAKVIVRVGIGSVTPLHPGPQHVGDFTRAFRLMMEAVPVVQLRRPEDVIPAYKLAMNREGSTVLVELSDLYL